jgi:N-acetylglucosaminyl-diphospho-decaprenol L-rhamnosyltransferase
MTIARETNSAKPTVIEASSTAQHDLAVIVISTNEVGWLGPCLSTVFEKAGPISLDVVVVDNSSTDGTREYVESTFPRARVVTSENHGFGHANNRGALTCNARYVLFLNPDTELVEGTLAGLVAAMDERPNVGLVGVRQVTGDGTLYPTIRYFPTISRALGEALGSERWPVRPSWAGERELDLAIYDREVECDWTVGAFMLVRREALLGAGLLDERFFLQSEEPDLCRRIKAAGWTVRHLPVMTIIHRAGKAGVIPKMVAQSAFARRQYADKHFSAPYAGAYLAASSLNYVLRAAASLARSDDRELEAARRALRTLSGRADAPYELPPPTAVRR